MLFSKVSSFFFVVFILLFIAGCSSGGGNPVAPLAGNNLPDTNYESLAVGVSDYDSNGNPIAGYGALGVFSVHVDKDLLTGDFTPLRSTASTDVLEVVDITNFLMMAPCSDCAKLMSIELDADNNLVLKIGIKHPFPAGDPLKPISGKNRGDLHVFNIEGLIISDGAGTTIHPGIGVTIGNVGLINADGYSPYLDEVLDEIYPTDATVHPYILHFDDYSVGNYDASNPMGFQSVTDPPPSGNLVMAMGCDYDIQDYKFNLDGALDFIYAVGCTYAVSADSYILRFTPEYRVPQHLKKAASEAWVEITNNELVSGDTLSSADLDVFVVDINHGVAVGSALDEMSADSSVAEILVEVPGVTSGSVSFGNTPISGTGHDPSDPLLFQGTITNAAGGIEGTYTGLVKVIDSYPTGVNVSPLLDGKDGIRRVEPIENPLTGMFEITEFASYSIFSIDVASGSQVVADIQANPHPDAHTCQFISFDASGSHDNGGFNIVEYQWDWDYTGVPAEFNADRTTDTPFIKHQYFTEGSHTTGLIVVNDAPVPQSSGVAFITHDLTRPLPADYVVQEVNKVSTNNDTSNYLGWPASNTIVVDDNDIVHIFSAVYDSVAHTTNLVHYSYDNGTTIEENLGNIQSEYHQSAVIDSQGTIHVVWYGSSNLNYSENSSGSFASPTVLESSFEGFPYTYTIGINGQDELMVIFYDMGGSHPIKYMYKWDTTWSTPEVLTYPEYTYSGGGNLAIMVSCQGTPGDNGSDFHLVYTEQYETTHMNPVVTYQHFDRSAETWSAEEYPSLHYNHYQDWSDIYVTSDNDVFISSSIYWTNTFVCRKDGQTGVWNTWMITNSSNDEYTSTIGANDDGTICVAYWERIGWPDPDPFEVQFKVFHEDMSQADVLAIPAQPLDSSTTAEYRHGDIYMKECNYYVAFCDRRHTGAGYWQIYYSRISLD